MKKMLLIALAAFVFSACTDDDYPATIKGTWEFAYAKPKRVSTSSNAATQLIRNDIANLSASLQERYIFYLDGSGEYISANDWEVFGYDYYQGILDFVDNRGNSYDRRFLSFHGRMMEFDVDETDYYNDPDVRDWLGVPYRSDIRSVVTTYVYRKK